MVTRQEVVEQVTELVNKRYGGDWRRAFDHEDDDGDGKLSTSEICSILARAGVGLRLTRWAVALQIVEAMDADNDDLISWEEFRKMTHV